MKTLGRLAFQGLESILLVLAAANVVIFSIFTTSIMVMICAVVWHDMTRDTSWWMPGISGFASLSFFYWKFSQKP